MRQDKRIHVHLECVSLLNQWEMCYLEPISLCNEIGDVALVRMSPIRGEALRDNGVSRISSLELKF
jgi:hypothetical protein